MGWKADRSFPLLLHNQEVPLIPPVKTVQASLLTHALPQPRPSLSPTWALTWVFFGLCPNSSPFNIPSILQSDLPNNLNSLAYHTKTFLGMFFSHLHTSYSRNNKPPISLQTIHASSHNYAFYVPERSEISFQLKLPFPCCKDNFLGKQDPTSLGI